MLNEALIAEFQLINQEQRSGTLRIQRHDDQSVQFYFEEGNLRILDFAEPKELLLLRQYRRYHKIGVEIQAMVEQLYHQQDIAVSDYLLQQQLVSEDEITQVTRTLVEDVLCDCFGQDHAALMFDDESQADDFDLELRAVKLRIDVTVLVEMVEARVAERDAVQLEITSFDQPYSLMENAPDQDQLNDTERQVLLFVDGRHSVNSIAQATRDSALNIACYLTSLSQQGFVEPRAAGTTSRISSGVRPVTASLKPSGSATTTVNLDDYAARQEQQRQQAIAAAQPTPTAAEQVATVPVNESQRIAAAASQVMSQPRSRRTVVEAPRSRFGIYLGLVVLVLAVGLVVMIVAAGNRSEAISASTNDLRRAVASNQWLRANTLVAEAMTAAGNDVVIQREITNLLTQFNNVAFAEQLAELESAIAERDLTGATALLAALPQPAQVGKLWQSERLQELSRLRLSHNRLQREFDNLETSLSRQVAERLARGQVAEAMALLDAQPEAVHGASLDSLRTWRRSQFDLADNSKNSIDQRRQALAALRASRLNEGLQGDVDRIQQEIDQGIARLRSKLQDLTALYAEGDYATVLERLPPIQASVVGGELESEVEALELNARQMAEMSQQLADQARTILASGIAIEQLQQVVVSIQQRLTELPQLSDGDRLRGLAQALGLVATSIQADSFAAEGEALAQVLALPSVEPQVVQLIESRRRRLELRVSSMQRRVQQVRELIDQGKYIDAQRELQLILEDPDLVRSGQFPVADLMWNEITERELLRAEEMTSLLEAMRRDDGEAVARYGRQLGLPRLPLAVRTVPAGATVLRGGEVLGLTPLVIDDLRAERVDDRYEITLPGYDTVTLTPLDAVGGWRLSAELHRASVLDVTVPAPITAQPAMIGQDLWLSGSNHAVKISPDGQYEVVSFATLRVLQQPVYAPVRQVSGMVMITTRDRLALLLDQSAAEETNDLLWSLPVATNYPAISYLSPLVMDRRVVVAGGIGGRLAASDSRSPDILWQHDGAPLACAPVLRDEQVHIARRDGSLLAVSVEDGSVIEAEKAGGDILTAWLETNAIAGYTARRQWRWDGRQIQVGELPAPIIAAGQGVVINDNLHVSRFDQRSAAWQPLGRVTNRADLPRIMMPWGDMAVMVWGQRITILGNRGFTLTTDDEFVDPAVINDHLVVATTDGRVQIFAP